MSSHPADICSLADYLPICPLDVSLRTIRQTSRGQSVRHPADNMWVSKETWKVRTGRWWGTYCAGPSGGCWRGGSDHFWSPKNTDCHGDLLDNNCDRQVGERGKHCLGAISKKHWSNFYLQISPNNALHDAEIGCISLFWEGAKKYKFSFLLCAVHLSCLWLTDASSQLAPPPWQK